MGFLIAIAIFLVLVRIKSPRKKYFMFLLVLALLSAYIPFIVYNVPQIFQTKVVDEKYNMEYFIDRLRAAETGMMYNRDQSRLIAGYIYRHFGEKVEYYNGSNMQVYEPDEYMLKEIQDMKHAEEAMQNEFHNYRVQTILFYCLLVMITAYLIVLIKRNPV